jgi:hypothetical protein
VNPADAQLVAQIQQATHGGSRLLCTLARRGKALERDEPERAGFLLMAVRLHPLYKGGRLAFDMLEIEDLMLEDSTVDSINTVELTQVLKAGARNLVDVLRRIGSSAQDGAVAAEPPVGQTDLFGHPVGVRARPSDGPREVPVLPRVSFGPAHDGVVATDQPPPSDAERNRVAREPELTSSDYLYDYVVLGFLDLLGGIALSP